MPKEKEGFRDCIELLNARFPEKDMLNVKEVMEFCGISRDTAKRKIRFGATGKVTKADLARQVCI